VGATPGGGPYGTVIRFIPPFASFEQLFIRISSFALHSHGFIRIASFARLDLACSLPSLGSSQKKGLPLLADPHFSLH
jgi:hypothetical protein